VSARGLEDAVRTLNREARIEVGELYVSTAEFVANRQPRDVISGICGYGWGSFRLH
jgi:hypothetical protein